MASSTTKSSRRKEGKGGSKRGSQQKKQQEKQQQQQQQVKNDGASSTTCTSSTSSSSLSPSASPGDVLISPISQSQEQQEKRQEQQQQQQGVEKEGNGATKVNGVKLKINPKEGIPFCISESQMEYLCHPMPTLMPLVAAIYLLDSPLVFRRSLPEQHQQQTAPVYLIPRDYLVNWFYWAYHHVHATSKQETRRLKQALTWAVQQMNLHNLIHLPPTTPRSPSESSNITSTGTPKAKTNGIVIVHEYHDPGPIDNTLLGDFPNQPLKLNKRVVLHSEQQSNDNTDIIVACAVPQQFYLYLQTIHGVVCEDGVSIAFQPDPPVTPQVLYHSPATTNGHSRPLDFRRFVTLASDQQQQVQQKEHHRHSQQQEKQHANIGKWIPRVELHPIVFSCQLVGEMNQNHDAVTHIELSRTCPVPEAIKAILKIMAPQKSSQCARVWHQRWKPLQFGNGENNKNIIVTRHGTRAGDGYDLVSYDPNLIPKSRKQQQNNDKNASSMPPSPTPSLTGAPSSKIKPFLTVEEWMEGFSRSTQSSTTVSILVETRTQVTTPWSRRALEFENRLQVGDFVDAQDTTGKWYEAIVRDISDEVCRVHYAGWNSKWDTRIRRRTPTTKQTGANMIEGIPKTVRAPAPLWTFSRDWRSQLKVGDAVEIRDSKSLAHVPKWIVGKIVALGRKKKKKQLPPAPKGGAVLEELEYADSNGNLDDTSTTITTSSFSTSVGGEDGGDTRKRTALKLLNRHDQILVEVPNERVRYRNSTKAQEQQSDDDDETDASDDLGEEGEKPRRPKAEPPAIRWVYLYGEEICQLGTHLNARHVLEQDHTAMPPPSTIQYDFDPRKPPVEILKSFGQGFVRESIRGLAAAPGSVGLQNLGNSCFMNSIVQCLNHIEPLTKYFFEGDYMKDLNKKNPLGSGGKVTLAYASLLQEVWSDDYSTLAPRFLKQTIAAFAPQFNNVYQHDSHEFCSVLMDGLHEDCNRVKFKPYVEDLEGFGMPDDKVSIESWRKHLLRHDSIIVDHCQGMHRSHLTCPVCGRESIKFDVYSSISLPIAQSKEAGAPIPLADCLEKFQEGEQLDENNAWYCPNCEKHVCALKMLALWSVPDILIIHLKRFTYEHNKSGNGIVRNKIKDRVIFPVDQLDMTPYILGPKDDNAPPLYSLIGVSEHTGLTANSGHYTATVRNSKDGQWYRYNDSHVGHSTGDASVTGGAYLLFYKRTRGTLRWAGMEKVMQERNVDPHNALETDQDGFTQVVTRRNNNNKR